MRYFKSLGLTYAERYGGRTKVSAESLARASGITVTDISARAIAERQAFVASLKSCDRDDEQPGWLYTNRYDVVTCTADPAGDRNREFIGALAIVPPLISNKVHRKDGKWIPIIPIAPPRINKNYLRIVLNAQSNPAAQAAANKARVSWEALKGGQPYMGTGRAMSAAEVETAVNILTKEYSEGGKYYKKTKKAFIKFKDRLELQRHILERVIDLEAEATFTARGGDVPVDYTEDERLPEGLSEGIPKMYLVAGAVGVVVLGAVLLKGRK